MEPQWRAVPWPHDTKRQRSAPLEILRPQFLTYRYDWLSLDGGRISHLVLELPVTGNLQQQKAGKTNLAPFKQSQVLREGSKGFALMEPGVGVEVR